MSDSNPRVTFLEEFRNLISFLQSLWGLLTGITVLFPLSNAFVQIIPLRNIPEGGLAFLSPPLVTSTTTLAAIFAILWTFSQRGRLKAQRQRGPVQRRAARLFVAGLAALIIYLVAQYLVAAGFYFRVLQWLSTDLRQIFGDVILLLTYVAFFVLTTRAFLLLAIIEYYQKENGQAQ